MRFLTVVILMMLSACAKPEVIGIDAETIAAMKLQDVVVTYHPHAQISWEDAVSDYAKSVGAKRPSLASAGGPDAELDPDLVAEERAYREVVESDAAKAFVRERLTTFIDRAVRGGGGEVMLGDRPVGLEAKVGGIIISSVGRRLMLGGNHRLFTGVTLVDAETGVALAKQKPIQIIATGGSGIGGVLVSQAFDAPEKRLEDGLRAEVTSWLRSGTGAQ